MKEVPITAEAANKEKRRAGWFADANVREEPAAAAAAPNAAGRVKR
jgi:hypothetical protein